MVHVYGKNGCKICESAKEKLSLMGVEFGVQNLDEKIAPHDGWRDDKTLDLMASYAMFDTLPLIEVDGVVYDYPGAMRALKQKQTANV